MLFFVSYRTGLNSIQRANSIKTKSSPTEVVEVDVATNRCVHGCALLCVCECACGSCCGVATISRLLKIIGLFYRIQSLLQGSFAKEVYNFKEPTNRSHPMSLYVCLWVWCLCS